MSVLDFDSLGRHVDLPISARKLLESNEKEIQCNLALRVHSDRVIDAKCYVVYHSLARGPAKGGIRMAPHATLEHTRDLAERMTYKASLVGIPFGGGKSAIRVDGAALSRFEKTALMREYCHVLELELDHGLYIPAPDMGTNPTDMAVICGRFHRPDVVTGKPPRIGGLPGRNEATGRGVAYTCERAAQYLWGTSSGETSALAGRRVAIQGFGNVGRWTARFCADWGATVIAITDINGGVFCDTGLSVDALWSLEGAELGFKVDGGESINNRELLSMDADIVVPAALEGQITPEIAEVMGAKAVVEGANGPTTPEADTILAKRDIPVFPDILANAGGVTASYVEWRNAKSGSITYKEDTYETIHETLGRAFDKVTGFASEHGVTLRTAAEAIALREVVGAMRDRSWI